MVVFKRPAAAKTLPVEILRFDQRHDGPVEPGVRGGDYFPGADADFVSADPEKKMMTSLAGGLKG